MSGVDVNLRTSCVKTTINTSSLIGGCTISTVSDIGVIITDGDLEEITPDPNPFDTFLSITARNIGGTSPRRVAT